MKKLFDEFINSSPLQKLAILANVSTILGVSIATFVAGPFLSSIMGREFDLADFIISILFIFVFFMIAALIIINAAKMIIGDVKSKNYPILIRTIVIHGLILWFIVVIFPYAKLFIGNLFNVSFMLPEPAKSAVASVKINPSALRYQEPDMYAIAGTIYLKPNSKLYDYEIVLYKKLEGLPNYEINYASNQYKVSIKSNGEFQIPMINIKRLDHMNELYIVVFRKCDSSFASSSGIYHPNKLSEMPDARLDKLNPFIQKVTKEMLNLG
jgi:hypothetical protein